MPRKPKPLTAKTLHALISPIENKNIPIVPVGERQVVIDAWIVSQEPLGGEFGKKKVPVAIEIQLIPVG